MIEDIARVLLLHRETTKQAIMNEVRGLTPPLDISHNVRIEHSMDNLAHTFKSDNLALLVQLRALGHVSLEHAATTLGFADVLSFIERTMDGLNLYLQFVPTQDGKPGICVPFNKLLIDLDLDDKIKPEADIAFHNQDERRQFFADAEAGRVEVPPGTWWRHMEAWEWGDKGIENGWTFEEMRHDTCRILTFEIEQLIGVRPSFDRLLEAALFNFVLGFLVLEPNVEKALERFLTKTLKLLYDPNDQMGNFRRLDAGLADAIGVMVSPLHVIGERKAA